MHEAETLRLEHETLLALIGAKDLTEARFILDALRRSRHDALNDAAAYKMMAEHVARQLGIDSVPEIPTALAKLIARASMVEFDIEDLAGTQAEGLAEQREPAEAMQ